MPERNLRMTEGREAKRQEWTDNSPGAVATMNNREVFAALDGLGIAQEMAWGYQVEDVLLGMLKWERWDYWYDAALDFLDDVLAKWDHWKGAE